jgi:inner membrane protein
VPAPWTPRLLHVAAPLLACLSIVALDLILAARSWSVPATGLLDEAAHLLTAWIVLNACARGRTRSWPWVLLGAVVIDVDHIPLYLWGAPVAAGGGRPVTHSLLTVLVLLAVALAVSRFRTAASGLAAGVLLHFLRDVATGPGLPLLWPFWPDDVLLPYGLYLLVLTALAMLGVVKLLRLRRAADGLLRSSVISERQV